MAVVKTHKVGINEEWTLISIQYLSPQEKIKAVQNIPEDAIITIHDTEDGDIKNTYYGKNALFSKKERDAAHYRKLSEYDTKETRAARQRKRRAALKLFAQSHGYSSISALETALLNGAIVIVRAEEISE